MKLILEPRLAPNRAMAVLSPVIAIALTLLVGAALLAALGHAPVEALHMLFASPLLDAYSRSEVLVKAIPLALIGAGLAVCFRANVWNIGAAGQYTLGAVFAGGLALSVPPAATETLGALWLLPYLAAGMLGGMAWAAIPAFLRTRFNANEILVSLMLAYAASLLLDYLVRGPWKDPMAFGFPQSPDFPAAFIAPVIWSGTRVHIGLIIAVAVAIGLALLMARSLKGFELKAFGAAPRAAAFAGFSQSGAVWFALLLSGALAGLAGALEASATIGKLQPEISAGYGFSAIIVAFLGRLHPVGALFGALLLAISYIGGENAQVFMQLPRNVTAVFQGLLLFFLLACDTLIRRRIRLVRRRAGLGPA